MDQRTNREAAQEPVERAGDEDGRDRKAEHIRLALDGRMQCDRRFLDEWAFEHVALPEIDLDDVDLSTEFLGRRLSAPLLISCMTGGTTEASRINRNLALGAEEVGIAIGVGSQRKALEDDATADSFKIRPFAPSVPILANLGAIQLNYGYGIDACRQAVRMVDADALTLHLNPLQEAIQPEGQTRFRGLLPKIAEITRDLEVPVIVKEIGCGLGLEVARKLADAGVRILDSSGLGGTSWARIEAARADDIGLGERFVGWGVSTPDSIRALRSIPGVTVIGSGGVRHGVDVAKAIALGADLVGLAYPFLVAARESADAVTSLATRVIREVKICMFCLGVTTVRDLRKVSISRNSQWSVT